MKRRIKKILFRLSRSPLGFLLVFVWNLVTEIQIGFCRLLWFLQGHRKPNADEQKLVREQVTFLFKSFERQNLAKKLYRNIQRYYPGVRVIIVDDSRKALELSGPGLEIIQLPFNVGLSAGLNRGLEKVETPFVIRMDDDELLTPSTKFHEQLRFLLAHPEVDLAGVLPMNFPVKKDWRNKELNMYRGFSMANAPKPLKIPHGTWLDESHIVLGKVPNIFAARTEAYRALGYDDRIRMIDHHEFFYRAAGNLTAVLDPACFVIHNHCPFKYSYQVYRADIAGDKRYIAQKHLIFPGISKDVKSADEELIKS